MYYNNQFGAWYNTNPFAKKSDDTDAVPPKTYKNTKLKFPESICF